MSKSNFENSRDGKWWIPLSSLEFDIKEKGAVLIKLNLNLISPNFNF